ncbi:hypothetical protein RJ639_019771, partial [Escallonia herrerae]
MQRYHAASCTGAVNNSAIGGASARDTSRAESSPANFSLNPRRPVQLTPYKLRSDKDPLNSRLGPPDFQPPTPTCPEETLTKEYVQSGYRETVEGLEYTYRIEFLATSLLEPTAKLVDPAPSIRKCHRAINESRAQKRKAGQVYGVPLSGSLLSKHGIFPEQKPCGEDFRKKWIEGLLQQHKRLRSLADHVPHCHKKTSLFEVLIRNHVPLLRATWFIKVTYLNQVRPGSSSISSGAPDKIQLARSDQWTKDVIDYLQDLLDEFFSRNGSHSSVHNRDRSSQIIYGGSMQHKSNPILTLDGGEEPSLHFKWWYMVRILQWHHAEGLLLPSLIIEWVLKQLQEKELLELLQLLLPVIYGVIETVVLSQNYVRTLVRIAVRFIKETSPGGSDLVDNSRRAYTISALGEMLRYLVLTVPDTFVALDCFPLPSCVVSDAVYDGGYPSKIVEEAKNLKNGPVEGSGVLKDKRLEVQCQPLSIERVVSSIQRRAGILARAARPGHSGPNAAKAIQALDQCLLHGDVALAHKSLFENLCDGVVDKRWTAEVSSCLHSSLEWIGTVSLSFVCSVFFVCEWASCDFRHFRGGPPHGLKFTGRRDFSQVYLAIRLLKLEMRTLQNSLRCKCDSITGIYGPDQINNCSGRISAGNTVETKTKSKVVGGKSKSLSDIFQSPGPLHDIIVSWIDQHETQNGEGFKRLQLLIIELTRSGIFYPQAYVRQLIVSGIMDRNDPMVDIDRRKRHYKILKQLPGPYIRDALEEAQIAEVPLLAEAMNVYSNERRLLLRGLLDHHKNISNTNSSSQMRKNYRNSIKAGSSFPSIDQMKPPSSVPSSLSRKNASRVSDLEELKDSISMLLQLPSSSSTSTDAVLDESQGIVKRPTGSVGYRTEGEGTPGCEECRRAKRQRLSEERSSYFHGHSPNPSDDEDVWWVRKGPKTFESFKADPPVKAAKQASRGRQKTVRKTQSLAQLAAARIEGSQGASTSHVCDSRIICPHHRIGNDGDAPTVVRAPRSGDIVSIGKIIKKLQFVDKRVISVWLIAVVRQLVEEAENTAPKAGQYSRPFPDDRSSVRWKLGEDELSSIMYLMDVSSGLVSAARFLLWLLPKVPNSHIPTVYGGRNILMPPRNVENHVCTVGEAFLLSSLRRYENLLVATDLIPETLSAAMQRAAAVMASNGRVSGSAAFVYARHLLKKYGNVASVAEWEKNFRVTCDKRLASELDSGRTLDGEFGFPLGVPAGVAQEIVMGLMECIRQTGGAAQEGDPTLVSSAVSAVVSSVGQVIAKMPDLTASGYQSSFQSTAGSLNFARRILRIHVICLFLLKEALGVRQSRVFEIALATEASSALAQVFAPGKGPRSQFLSPEAHDPNGNLSNEFLSSSTKGILSRAVKTMAAVSALVLGAVLHGVASLERMLTVFRLKEGLDVIQFVRSTRSSSNGSSRSIGVSKMDNLVEVSVHWFRVLVGNCRTISDGFIVELLGEAAIVALSRMQRTLPISLVLQPAFCIFGFVIWRPFILNASIALREDIQQLYQSLTTALVDAIKHLPFRDVCLRDTRGFYDLVSGDATDFEFAALLELSGSDTHLKAMAFVPLRARLFLNTIIDCKMPQDDWNQASGHGEPKVQHAENEPKLLEKLVLVLDTLQPAKFHWQWVELRLLLNEQALIEKLEAHDTSLVEAVRYLLPNNVKAAASENENN